jgi:hypothetical protein
MHGESEEERCSMEGALAGTRKSPLRMFGNVLVLATKNHSHAGKISTLTIHGGYQDQFLKPFYLSLRKLSPMGNKRCLELRSDLASLRDFPKLNSNLSSTPESYRASSTGRVGVGKQPNTSYSPAKRLVKLFNRMGRRQKKPNTART